MVIPTYDDPDIRTPTNMQSKIKTLFPLFTFLNSIFTFSDLRFIVSVKILHAHMISLASPIIQETFGNIKSWQKKPSFISI